VLGRNLEGVVMRAMELKTKWQDTYVSVEHLILVRPPACKDMFHNLYHNPLGSTELFQFCWGG
jgi:hypothetical protein